MLRAKILSLELLLNIQTLNQITYEATNPALNKYHPFPSLRPMGTGYGFFQHLGLGYPGREGQGRVGGGLQEAWGGVYWLPLSSKGGSSRNAALGKQPWSNSPLEL